MSWFSNFIGDVTNTVEDIVPGAKQVDQFLNKAGIGPANAFQNPFKPTGWAGDIEHGLSQVQHNPYVRSAEELAAAIAAAYAGQEYLVPYLTSAATATDAVSAADLASMDAAVGSDIAAGGSAATAADAASIAADAGVPGAAAATAADAAPGITADALAGTPLETSVAPPLFASADPTVNPLTFTGGAVPNAAAGGYTLPSDLQGLDFSVPSAQTEFDIGAYGSTPADYAASAGGGGAGGGGSGWLSQMGKFLATPKGALTGASLGAGLYGLVNRAQLPGAAKTALNASGPAVAQAQQMIASGGTASPLWTQQKASIDAQIDQQISDFSKALQQQAVSGGMGNQNSEVVQRQIAEMTSRLNVQREQMYLAAQQQNVSNAVAELTGGNQTLMGIANLQFQEDQAAQQIAKDIGLVTGNLASLWPATTTAGG